MTRSQLEHLISASGTIADDDDIVVIGSQSILGQFPFAPAELLVSRDADVYPRMYPERAELIDPSIGAGSPFERTYGYYAHGVGPETAVLPRGWEERLVLVSSQNTRFVRGWCLEAHDAGHRKTGSGPGERSGLCRGAAAARNGDGRNSQRASGRDGSVAAGTIFGCSEDREIIRATLRSWYRGAEDFAHAAGAGLVARCAF